MIIGRKHLTFNASALGWGDMLCRSDLNILSKTGPI